jgi:hypothetical protein
MKLYQFLGLAGLCTSVIIGSATLSSFAQSAQNDEKDDAFEEYHHGPYHHGQWHKGKRMHDMGFDMMDHNGDGQISREEFENRAKSHFIAMDTNNDKEVTSDEIKAFMDQHHKQHLDKKVAHMMERIDTDKSGTISEDEFEAMKAHRRAKRHEYGRRGHHSPEGGPRGHHYPR